MDDKISDNSFDKQQQNNDVNHNNKQHNRNKNPKNGKKNYSKNNNRSKKNINFNGKQQQQQQQHDKNQSNQSDDNHNDIIDENDIKLLNYQLENSNLNLNDLTKKMYGNNSKKSSSNAINNYLKDIVNDANSLALTETKEQTKEEVKDNSALYANQLFGTINTKSEMFLNKFWKIYVKLLESLHLIWPQCVVTELFLDITLKYENNHEEKQNVIETWYTTLKPYFKDCLDHNILKISKAKISFIEKIDFIKKYEDVKDDEESCNNIWEFIINLNRYSLEYHNWSKDDFMNKMITTVTNQIGKSDINNLLNDMDSFGTLVSNVASSMQDNPGSAFKILKKALVINQDVNQKNDENKNLMNMIGNIPVDDSIKNMIYSHKELYTNNDPNEIWENLSSDDESESESRKKTIEERKNKKY